MVAHNLPMHQKEAQTPNITKVHHKITLSRQQPMRKPRYLGISVEICDISVTNCLEHVPVIIYTLVSKTTFLLMYVLVRRGVVHLN